MSYTALYFPSLAFLSTKIYYIAVKDAPNKGNLAASFFATADTFSKECTISPSNHVTWFPIINDAGSFLLE